MGNPVAAGAVRSSRFNTGRARVLFRRVFFLAVCSCVCGHRTRTRAASACATSDGARTTSRQRALRSGEQGVTSTTVTGCTHLQCDVLELLPHAADVCPQCLLTLSQRPQLLARRRGGRRRKRRRLQQWPRSSYCQLTGPRQQGRPTLAQRKTDQRTGPMRVCACVCSSLASLVLDRMVSSCAFRALIAHTSSSSSPPKSSPLELPLACGCPNSGFSWRSTARLSEMIRSSTFRRLADVASLSLVSCARTDWMRFLLSLTVGSGGGQGRRPCQ